jgi:hypothetical protein
MPDRCDDIGIALDCLIRPERQYGFLLRCAHLRRHPRPAPLGKLHRCAADAAGGAGDEHPFGAERCSRKHDGALAYWAKAPSISEPSVSASNGRNRR